MRRMALIASCLIALALALVFFLDRDRFGGGSSSTRVVPNAAPAAKSPPSAPLATPTETSPIHRIEDAKRNVDEAPVAAAVPIAPADPATKCFGRVVDGASVPVPEFVVEARAVDRSRPEFGRDDAEVTKLAGREGRFALDTLPRREWQFVAIAPSGARSAPLYGRLPWKGEPPTLIIADPVRVEGVVTGRNDAPVDGAEVFFAYAGEDVPTPHSMSEHPTASARTDANGRFSIASVRPGRIALVAAHDDYCNSDYLRIDVAATGAAEIRLELRDGAHVVGSIDPSMGALADREVDLFSFRGLIGWRQTKSDAQGRFDFEHVIPQEYVIELKSGEEFTFDRVRGIHAKETPPGAPKNRGLRKNIEVRDGETTRLVLGEEQHRIRGRGRVTCRGASIVGAQMGAISSGSNEDLEQVVHTAEDGTFSLEFAGPGWYQLSAFWKSAQYEHEIYVPTDGSVDLSFEVPSGGILGRLVDASGKPLANVHVTLTDAGRIANVEGGDPHGPSRTTRTNQDGSFEMRMVPPGTYTLAAPDGLQFFQSAPVEPYGRVFRRELAVDTELLTGIELKLEPEGRIAGKVVDELGRPAGGAHLLILDDAGRPCSTYWETTANESGAFLIRSVAPGTYHVIASREKRMGESAPVDVEADTTAETTVELPAK